ncbi:hypothetical protein ACCO45_012751 [Purpureocillium lilacinum]|uniref:Uncharacterized protein n=1 Tax=Purpureocillium lilacinum TaxID=33203 RepID=A0ACC4DBZ1_PURLI
MYALSVFSFEAWKVGTRQAAAFRCWTTALHSSFRRKAEVHKAPQMQMHEPGILASNPTDMERHKITTP